MHNDVMSMEAYWCHSINTAIVSRELAWMSNFLDNERVFVNGLLQDIGHRFTYQAVPERAVEAVEMVDREKMPLHEAENAILGLKYAEIGAEVMHRWDLLQSLWEPTRHQADPHAVRQVHRGHPTLAYGGNADARS